MNPCRDMSSDLARPVRRGELAFTMIEVAVSIAIVAFALVAILGVLPTGINVQRENREDTIIAHDANFFLEAILSGTNSASFVILATNMDFLDVTIAGVHQGTQTPSFTNGNLSPDRIVSYLSMPQLGGNSAFGRFRSFSSSLADRAAGTNGVAFTYLVTTEISPVADYTSTLAGYTNYARYLTNNLFDVRLHFRWPVFGDGTNYTLGNGRLTVRRLVSGALIQDTNALYNFVPGAFFGP
jgi:type II secretory pathway pseudopilin PulG